MEEGAQTDCERSLLDGLIESRAVFLSFGNFFSLTRPFFTFFSRTKTRQRSSQKKRSLGDNKMSSPPWHTSPNLVRHSVSAADLVDAPRQAAAMQRKGGEDEFEPDINDAKALRDAD